MSHTLTIEEAASRLAELVSGLHPGDEVTLTSNNRPVAKIVPSQAPNQQPGRRPGAGKGLLIENPDVPEDAYLEDFKEYMQ